MTDLRNHPDLAKAPFVTPATGPWSVKRVEIGEFTFGTTEGAPVTHEGVTVVVPTWKGIHVDQPLTYLMGDEDGVVSLVCEAPKCMTPGDCSDGLCFLRIELPFKCSPWQAAGALTAHLREAHGGA